MWDLPPPEELRWQLHERFHPAILSGARQGIGDVDPLVGTKEDLIERCVQEVRDRLSGDFYDQLTTFRFESVKKFAGFVRRFAHFHGQSLARKEIRQSDRAKSVARTRPSSSLSILANLCQEEDSRRIPKLLLDLRPQQRNAIRQRFYENRSVDSIAKRMDLPVEDVDRLIQSGLEALRAGFEN